MLLNTVFLFWVGGVEGYYVKYWHGEDGHFDAMDYAVGMFSASTDGFIMGDCLQCKFDECTISDGDDENDDECEDCCHISLDNCKFVRWMRG